MFRRDDKRRSYAGGEAPVHSSALAAASALGRALHPDGKSVDHSKIPSYNKPSRSASVRNVHAKAGRPNVKVSRNGSIRRQQTAGDDGVAHPSTRVRNSASSSDLRVYRRASSLPTKMRTSSITRKQKSEANAAFDGFEGQEQHSVSKRSSQQDLAPQSRPRTVRKYIPGPNGLITVDVPVREDTGADVYVPKKSSNSSLRRSQSMNRVLSNSSQESASSQVPYRRSPSVRHSLTKGSEEVVRTRHHQPKSNDKLAAHSKRAASLTNRIKSQFATPIIETAMTEEAEETISELSPQLSQPKPRRTGVKRSKVKSTPRNVTVEPEAITTDIDDILDGGVPPLPRSSSGETELDFSDEFPDFANDTMPSNYDTVRPMVMEEDEEEDLTDPQENANAVSATDLTETESVGKRTVSNTTETVKSLHSSPEVPSEEITKSTEPETDGLATISDSTRGDNTITSSNGIPASTGTLVNSEASDVDLGLMSRPMEANSTVTSVEVDPEQIYMKSMKSLDTIPSNPTPLTTDNADNEGDVPSIKSKNGLSPQHIELSSSNDMTYNDEASDEDGIKLAAPSSIVRSETESEKERSMVSSETSTIKRTTRNTKQKDASSTGTETVTTTPVRETLSDQEVVQDEEESNSTNDKPAVTMINTAATTRANGAETPRAIVDAEFSTPTAFLPEPFSPTSDSSSYMTTKDDIDLKNSVEDIIDAMDELDPELDSILTSAVPTKVKKEDQSKKTTKMDQKSATHKRLKEVTSDASKNPAKNDTSIKLITKVKKDTPSTRTTKKEVIQETSVNNIETKTVDRPEKDVDVVEGVKKSNFAPHFRSANPYLSIPPKSAKRLADKQKLQKNHQSSLDSVTVKENIDSYKEMEDNSTKSKAKRQSTSELKVPPPKQKQPKVVTPIKSALKSSWLNKSNSSSVYSDYSPAKGAYLSLTTAENTRLNSQIIDDIKPPRKVVASPRYARPQSMVARVNNRSESPTPKEKTRMNRNSVMGKISQNSTQRPPTDRNAEKPRRKSRMSQQALRNADKNTQPSKRISRSISTSHKLNEGTQSAKPPSSIPRSRSVYSPRHTVAKGNSVNTLSNIDPDLAKILYPKEPIPKKSSFEKLRNGEVHLGFKKMSLRDEIMQDEDNANGQQVAKTLHAEEDEANEVTGLFKSTGWTSRFQDSDSDDEFMQKISKPQSPAKEPKAKASNGFSLFKSKSPSESSSNQHNTNSQRTNINRAPPQQKSNGYSGMKSHMSQTGLRSSSAANYPQGPPSNNSRAVSDSVQPTGTGRLSERTLVPPPKESDDGKKSSGFGKKLKKIFGRRKGDM